MTQGSEVLVLTPSRLKSLLLPLVMAAIVFIGICGAMGGPEDDAWVMWVLAGIGLVGFLYFTAKMIPGACYLRLSPEGLVICHMWRLTRYRWSDIAEVGVMKITDGEGTSRKVGLNFGPALANPHGRSKRTLGFETALPDNYGMDFEALADLLNQWRTRHSAA